MAGDGIEDVVVACNSTKKIRNISNGVNAFEAPGGTICAKASMLLQVRALSSLCYNWLIFVILYENKTSFSGSTLQHAHAHNTLLRSIFI